MIAVIQGTILEVFTKLDKEKQEIQCVRIFQKGTKELIEIKNVPFNLYQENEKFVASCRLFAWANERGQANISCTYLASV